ncbi:hypothetical protein N7449_011325 [Penicillium cf. viridicatum]|uniref:Uncharacterized protein n=1 Tax=Penicillium cf. viridicatum TaxID=2972119 RepID=A0A9W9IZS9_9EURO|nr:hypothetical protein N7449_011325 [Penicillium cf. viridicatum]
MAMRKIEECVGFNHDIHVPEGTKLIELKVTLGSNKQIKQIDINCLPYNGNEVREFGGIFTDASPFQYQFDTPEVKGSITFDRDHESVSVLIDVTWNNKERVNVHSPVVVFC